MAPKICSGTSKLPKNLPIPKPRSSKLGVWTLGQDLATSCFYAKNFEPWVSWKNRKMWSQQVKPKPVCELSLSWGVHYPWSLFRPPTCLNLAECLAILLHFVEYSFAASTRPPSWLLCNLTVFDRVISCSKYDGCFEFARFLRDVVKSVPFECLLSLSALFRLFVFIMYF